MHVNEEMVKAILSSIDEAIHAVDEKGITIFYNQKAAQHDGLEIDEVLGKYVLDTFPSLTEKSSTLLKVIQTSKPIYHLPQSYKNVRGKLIDTINTTLPVMVDGKLIGAVEIAKDYSQLKLLSTKLVDLQDKVKKNTRKPDEIWGARYTFGDIFTKDPEFKQVILHAKKVATTSSTVLIYGETGTGKELLVQSIHNESKRKHAPFIAQNCAALPESLLESILFGTVKGSYTGAIDRPGLFELAHGGTLFLDEINSMPLELQSRLLRILEDGMVRRVGGTKAFHVDVRVIVAMNKNPMTCVRNNELRDDLFYRLNVFSLQIPPLRNRKSDILILTNHFVELYNQLFDKAITNIDQAVISYLELQDWPGNVRELKHIIEHAMNMVDGTTLTLSHFPHSSTIYTHPPDAGEIKALRQVLHETEISLIKKALASTDGNIVKAAKLLQIPRQTLQYKIKKYLI